MRISDWISDVCSSVLLVRDDYVLDALPLFTPDTGLLDIREDDSGSADTSFNEVIGTGRSPINNQDFQVRAQNLAASPPQQARPEERLARNESVRTCGSRCAPDHKKKKTVARNT